jgi:hypothetical protein
MLSREKNFDGLGSFEVENFILKVTRAQIPIQKFLMLLI